MDLQNKKGLSTEVLITLSAIIDKMEIADQLKNLNVTSGDAKKDNEELGKQLIVLLITKLHKAKEEIYDLIAAYKNIDREEAKKENAIAIIKEILALDGIKDFLS